MKQCRTLFAAVAVVFVSLMPVHVSAVDLDGFLGEINVRAKADMGDFRADLSATFSVSSGEVDDLFKICDSPADVYLTLRIGEVARVPIDRVVTEYRVNKDRGWGVIAKNLGIKPGSAEFHALKQGRMTTASGTDSQGKQGKSRGSGKSKGKR